LRGFEPNIYADKNYSFGFPLVAIKGTLRTHGFSTVYRYRFPEHSFEFDNQKRGSMIKKYGLDKNREIQKPIPEPETGEPEKEEEVIEFDKEAEELDKNADEFDGETGTTEPAEEVDTGKSIEETEMEKFDKEIEAEESIQEEK